MLKKQDYINVASIILSVVGIILEVIGGSLSKPTTVGFNLALSPVLYVGVALIVVALILSIAGSVMTEKYGLNKKISSIALYLSVILIMVSIVYVVLVIVMPVLNPTNG